MIENRKLETTQRRIRIEQQVQESNQNINTNGGPDLTESETLETFNNSDNLYLFTQFLVTFTSNITNLMQNSRSITIFLYSSRKRLY